MNVMSRLLAWAGHVLGRASIRVWIALVLAVMLVGVIAVARLIDTPAKEKETSGSDGGQRRATPSLPHDGDASSKSGDVAPSAAVAPPDAVNVATRFVTEWATHSARETPEQWWARVSPYADPQLAEDLKLTDPTRVPATKVTGQAKSVSRSDSETEVKLAIPTDAGDVLVVCTHSDGRWLVSDIDLANG